jgi:hypothetical protein
MNGLHAIKVELLAFESHFIYGCQVVRQKFPDIVTSVEGTRIEVPQGVGYGHWEGGLLFPRKLFSATSK